MGDEGLIED